MGQLNTKFITWLVKRLLLIPVFLVSLYYVIIALLILLPEYQPNFIYFHWVRVPFNADLSKPESFGLRGVLLKLFESL